MINPKRTPCQEAKPTDKGSDESRLPAADGCLTHEVLRDVDGLSGPRWPARQDVFSSPNQQVEQESVADTVRGGNDDLKQSERESNANNAAEPERRKRGRENEALIVVILSRARNVCIAGGYVWCIHVINDQSRAQNDQSSLLPLLS